MPAIRKCRAERISGRRARVLKNRPGFRDAASNAGRTYYDDRRNIRNSQHDPITREFRYSLHTVDVAKIDVYNNFCKRRNIASPVRKRIFLCVLFCKEGRFLVRQDNREKLRRDTRMRTDAGRVRKRSCRAEACLPSRKREPYSVAEARIACYSRENQKCFGGTHDPGSLFFDHISTIRKNAEGTSVSPVAAQNGTRGFVVACEIF